MRPRRNIQLRHPPTVFVVDDEPAVRESLSAVLRAHGVNAELFSSGEEFLAAYDPDRPGCLVEDMRLKNGMSGLQVHQALRDRGSALPIIMISGHADRRMAEAVRANGALALLHKPFPHQELLAHIRRAFEIDSQRRQPSAAIQVPVAAPPGTLS